jgi:transposase InsO family protein
MHHQAEKCAIFWCELLRPIIFEEIEEEGIHQFLQQTAQTQVVFPNGRMAKPSLSTLKRKLKKYRLGGFNALGRKPRNDKGQPRRVSAEIMAKAVELKKEQPYRSHRTINRFLQDIYGTTVCRSTLYDHLRNAGATRLKLGVTGQKVRKRWTTDHTHALWVGDFSDGPFVMEGQEVLPAFLTAFIDSHSRYMVVARYYLRENLDILIDALIRALAVHGAPLGIYVDNAKVYHSHGLKSACWRMGANLIFRKAGDPPGGGVIERFFLTAQNEFETEVRAGDILSLEQLNRKFSAWLSVVYHKSIHSEINSTPDEQYQKSLRVIRQVNMPEILSSFHQKVTRRVNPDFSDVQLNKMLFKVDPKLRGDKVEVRFDPFSQLNTVEVYSLRQGEYLGIGTLHQRQHVDLLAPAPTKGKPKHNYLDLLTQKHQEQLNVDTRGIDYHKLSRQRPWPFHEFAKTIADLLGKKGGLSDFTAQELETLKKTYNQSTQISKPLTKEAFSRTLKPELTYVIAEIKTLIKNKENA